MACGMLRMGEAPGAVAVAHDALEAVVGLERIAAGGDEIDDAVEGRAVEIAVQICRGLAHAHENGVVHRDIKPQNILLTEDGTAKVTDFGIARAVFSSTRAPHTSAAGTYAYMPPEQWDSPLVKAPSDVWAIGATLHFGLDHLPTAPLFGMMRMVDHYLVSALADPDHAMILMFSLAGVPPLLGFFGKFGVFRAAVDADLFWLAVLGGIASVLGAFYYLRIVYYMYFGEEREALDTGTSPLLWGVLMASAAVMVFGVINLFGIEPLAAAAAATLVN